MRPHPQERPLCDRRRGDYAMQGPLYTDQWKIRCPGNLAELPIDPNEQQLNHFQIKIENNVVFFTYQYRKRYPRHRS